MMNTRTFLLSLAASVLGAGTLFAADPAPPAAPAKPATPAPAAKKMETITLATGCFWCTEAVLQRIKGVEKVVSGYINGKNPNPTYEEVCTGLTGHAECVEVTFDTTVLPLEQLVDLFFDMHDPTTLNRQGADRGTQYRSGIYYHTDEQKATAEKVKAEVDKSGKLKDPIMTEIVKAGTFYPAEAYHQNYYNNNVPNKTGNYRYCQATVIPKLKKLGLLKPGEG